VKRLFAVIESPVTRVFLVGLFALSLQTTIFNTLRPFDVVLQVMLLFAISSGIAGGSESGALAGFAFGFMYDLILTTPLGLSGVVFGFAAYMAGGVNSFVHEPKWWFKIFSVAVSTATAIVLFPAACLVVGVDGLLDSRVIAIAVTSSVFNAIFALPAIRLMKWALVKPVRQAVWAE
jgi:rod shape-determining protein MreD